MKQRLVTKRKAQTKALSTSRKPNSKWNYDPSKARPASYEQIARQAAPAPELDPHTRHVLVTLAESVKEFQNLEERIAEASIAVRRLENQAANTPEGYWNQISHTLNMLQREFRERVPPLERQAGNQEHMLNRMDRLAERMDRLEKAVADAIEKHGEQNRDLLRSINVLDKRISDLETRNPK